MRIATASNFAPPVGMANRGVSANVVKGYSMKMVAAINAAYQEVNIGGAMYQRWFGGMAADGGTVLAHMTVMRDFANSPASLTLVLKSGTKFGAGSTAYAWPQGNRSFSGQFILNIGDAFGAPSVGAHAVLTNGTLQGACIQTMAHEMAHLIFAANISPPCPAGYVEEHYRDDALDLAGANPTYAAWNADNYGYLIEACTPP